MYRCRAVKSVRTVVPVAYSEWRQEDRRTHISESYFSLLVVGEDWQEQLAPYDETQEVAPYMRECNYCDAPSRAECIFCYGDGAYLSTAPPDSKFDYHAVGGRWAEFFHVKNPEDYRPVKRRRKGSRGLNQARKGDVDWDVVWEHRRELARGVVANAASEAAGLRASGDDEESVASLMKLRYDVRPGDDETTYLARLGIHTHALLADGIWQELGLWGPLEDHIERKWQDTWWRFVQALPDDAVLTILDCHAV